MLFESRVSYSVAADPNSDNSFFLGNLRRLLWLIQHPRHVYFAQHGFQPFLQLLARA